MIRDTFLPFSQPYVREEEIAAVVEVLRSGWISRGPQTARFEKEFAARLGAPSALALNSCTAALHLALMVLDIGRGDEVVVPTMTFCASANVVEHVEARPVLVDVDPETLNMDPAAAEAAVTDRTRALMVVHYGGHPAEMDALEALAEKHGLAVVEDAAHALPAAFRGRMVGSTGNLTAFSFYATKNLTTGDGGMLTGDPELIAKARVLSLHGMSADAWKRYSDESRWYYEVMVPGFKYNMTDVQAALGLVQLERLSVLQARRYEIVESYTDGLSDIDLIELPSCRSGIDSAWHLFPIRLRTDSPVNREEAIARLTEMNIGTSVHFIPVHLHPYYRDRYGYEESQFPVAQQAFEGLISLPLHPGLSDGDVADVIAAVRTVVLGSQCP